MNPQLKTHIKTLCKTLRIIPDTQLVNEVQKELLRLLTPDIILKTHQRLIKDHIDKPATPTKKEQPF